MELNEDAGFVSGKEVSRRQKEFPKLVSAHIRQSEYDALVAFAGAHSLGRGSQTNVSAVVRLAVEEFVSKIKAAELIK